MGEKILVVDDDVLMRRLLERQLTIHGYEARLAGDGEEALEMLKGELPRIILIDSSMPGMSGVELCRRIRADRALPFIHIIMITGRTETEHLVEALDAGADDYVTKPFEEKELLARLRAAQRVVRLERELTHVAAHDRLTGLLSRGYFNERLADEVGKWLKSPRGAYAVLFLDFDRFKLINDSFGHDTGDRLLQEIARRLTHCLSMVRSMGTVRETLAARLGGDEFVVYLGELADGSSAGGLAEGLLEALSEIYVIEGREIHTSASIGITTSAMGYQRSEDVLRDADTAMYHAKATGKARYVLFDQRMHEQVKARLEMENELRRALGRGEFLLHYQPIVSLGTGHLQGFEALLRWNHPERGIVSPMEFIPCLEETRLIIPTGYWVLNEACRQLREWKDRHPDAKGLRVGVNLSALQLTAPDLTPTIEEILRAHSLAGEDLVLEITENVLIQDPETAIQVLGRIRGLGVRLYMDDFGTGYSSLSCLHRFPLNGLKIDRSFMDNLSERRDYAAVVHAIVNLARNLEMMLIAEGIETAEQVVMLQALDCELGQGYYFMRPGDARAAEEFLAGRCAKPMAA